MSDYLTNLVARSVGSTSVLRPRLRSWFEPVASGEPLNAETLMEPRIAEQPAHESNTPVNLASAQPALTAPSDDATITLDATIRPLPARPFATLRPIQVDHFPVAVTPRFTSAPPDQTVAPMTKTSVQPPPVLRAPIDSAALAERKQVARQNEATPTRNAANAASVEPKESMLMLPSVAETSASAADASALEQTPIVARPRIARRQAERSVLHSSSVNEPTSAPAPTVQVTIGRIEVRANVAAPAAPKARSKPATQSLDDYLRSRDHGGAR